MNITIIGTGYVGLTSGACFAEFGFQVTCVDANKEKIKRLKEGEIPIYEPGLGALVERNQDSGRLIFMTDIRSAIPEADIIFIAVGTPSRGDDGYADLSNVYQVAKDIAPHLHQYSLIITKSTVPVGTARQVLKIIKENNPSAQFDVASNPEFLREGAAIQDFMNPVRIIAGIDSTKAQIYLQQLYHPQTALGIPMLYMDFESAELVKYASNAFLATKITFMNQIADLAEKCSADIQKIEEGMGLDPRIGNQFLRAGPGFGGSCFPKDIRALNQIAQHFGLTLPLVEAVMHSNEQRKIQMAERIEKACGGDVREKKIAILGLSFKPETDDIRESPALTIITWLQARGALIQAYDPAAMPHTKEVLQTINFAESSYEAARNAEVCVILTEWNEFKGLDLKRLQEVMQGRVMVDLRNIYDPKLMKNYGFHYISVGRPSISGIISNTRLSCRTKLSQN